MLQVASLDDLMANKVKVILQRVSAKDYIDIATMLSAGVSLDRGLAAAREMFGNAFQPSESLRAMTYFEGGDLYLLSADVKETLDGNFRLVPCCHFLSERIVKRVPVP